MSRRPGCGRGAAAGVAARAGRGDAGTATAELAVVLPGFAVVVGAALAAVAMVTVQLRCTDAAAVGARAAARGETAQVVRSATLAAAPPGARVAVAVVSGVVTVTVTARTGPSVGPVHLPVVAVHVSQPLEPGVAG